MAEPPALPAPGSVKKTSSRRSMTPERTGSSARRASPAAMAAAVPSRGDNPLQPEYYGGSAEAPQPEPEPEMLYSTKSNAAKVEAEKTKEGIGVPKSTIMVCGVCSLVTIVGLAIYIGFQKTDSNGVPHDEREPHAWLSEVDASNPLHMACNDSYNNFTAKCEPTIQEAAAAAPDPSVFTTCNRAACSGNGDCVNGDDPATARCACDENYLGFLCEEEGSVISIAGRSLGACPTPACGSDAGEEALAEGEACPSCQDYLNEMMDACVEHDIPWFHDMEDDVQLPTRARAIGCVMQGQSGERHEGETIFEDAGLLGEFLEHFVITGYVCYALALLCEDFFVHALDIIVEKLGLPPDVAGATFMAAGSSAPELFVSAAGVFITHDPVGVGACAGSTMFNTMCIIGGSAIIADKEVPLQWRAVVRDCGVYILSLVVLIIMLLDGKISQVESIIMLSVYIGYIALCAFWNKIVGCVCPVKPESVAAANDADDGHELLQQARDDHNETTKLARKAAGAAFRGGAKKAIAMQRLRAHTDMTKANTHLLKASSAEIVTPVSASLRKERRETMQLSAPAAAAPMDEEKGGLVEKEDGGAHDEHGEEHHEHPGLCDIPETSGGRVAWAVSFPLMFIFTFTVPDCKPGKHPSLYPLTFILCIVWLGILVEIMVEHASEFGALLGFSPGILGLTLLAGGTSFPDLVASLIVAKQGQIDMAVSNAFGSNNFDVLLCLGLPWFLSTCVVFGRPELIDTNGIMTALFSLIVTTTIWFLWMVKTKFTLTPAVGFSMLSTYGTWLICQFMLDIFSPEAHE